MADEKYVQFISNYDDWVAIRKLKIEPATEPRTVMEFLASLGISLDGKIEENLRKSVKLEKVDAAINALGLEKKDTAKALEEVNSRKVNSAIKEVIEELGEGVQKNEKKELEGFCRAYAMRKALKQCGIVVDYSSVEIPGMKRLKKAKV
ncbi:MAG: DUF2666 family protein [archaeon]|nr:DUF2666 family protein [archaeon]